MRVRIELYDPGHALAEPNVSGWATFAPGVNGLATFALDHEYPDWRPAPGWVLAEGGREWHVVAAEGKVLTVVEVVDEPVIHPNTTTEE